MFSNFQPTVDRALLEIMNGQPDLLKTIHCLLAISHFVLHTTSRNRNLNIARKVLVKKILIWLLMRA